MSTTSKKPSQRKDPRFLLRMPQNLMSHIEAAARANFRTRTSEILFRLKASIEGESIDEHGVIVQRTPAARK